ncbi:MAG: phosphopyruvate hydratase, partial [Pseudomonadota bacterium]
MTAIQSVHGRRVWDSRGNPTVEVDVTLETGVLGRAIAPSGASRGKREAIELRDGGTSLRGKGVASAVAKVNEVIAPALIGRDISDQSALDAALVALDPSPLKDTLGGNAVVATSLATLHAASHNASLPLWRHIANRYATTPTIPLPEIQIFGGGAHAGRRVDIQDFMIMVPGASDFDEVMEVTN